MIDSFNQSAAISLVIASLSLAALLYLAPKQMAEVLRPKNWLTGLRWRIFWILIFSIIGLIPSVVYLSIRTFGGDNEVLRSVASVAGNFSRLANVVLLIMVFNYRKKE